MISIKTSFLINACLLSLAFLLLLPRPLAAQVDELEKIDQLIWSHRIILVRPLSDCQSNTQALTANKADIDDRDIAWFVFCDEKVQSNYSAPIANLFISTTVEKYFLRDDVNVILIGKDGGVKRQTDNLDLNRLFELIDSMPMMQQERKQ